MEAAPTQCQYSYKVCSHPRSRKRNGSLHQLCEFHRQKANRIQQVYTNKKRALKVIEPVPFAAAETAVPVDEIELLAALLLEDNNENAWASTDGPTMTADETRILYELLHSTTPA
ncbi:hypothetical protein SPRG_13587 [Saprolegnia parasitica CBS 223.65]|uniref:Uncharacterized protein n=1 Tax=Saprolegnia parasitica (strain CBS 223.65) TaxID=695850 RepID=A0A067BSR3_SAPPC|nr:hypothetical protein SPRG_13587 [Saprolegnia parasitica CBS 223.65]KDO21288.1 hypothetical protein SPRG_13587 [Saprolegnia parasitica CBS 223.65]|eukprot:XP_012208030.1 hypothetical protein SPRG_13587 [Saprolegnia parasitica CBS 223.65]